MYLAYVFVRLGFRPLSLLDCRCVFFLVTQGLPYLSLFTPGAIRYDLNGLPAGSVTEGEILHARQACERILRFLTKLSVSIPLMR
ncbi:TPA: ProQ/FINO family protein [Salmonella enterica]